MSKRYGGSRSPSIASIVHAQRRPSAGPEKTFGRKSIERLNEDLLNRSLTSSGNVNLNDGLYPLLLAARRCMTFFQRKFERRSVRMRVSGSLDRRILSLLSFRVVSSLGGRMEVLESEPASASGIGARFSSLFRELGIGPPVVPVDPPPTRFRASPPQQIIAAVMDKAHEVFKFPAGSTLYTAFSITDQKLDQHDRAFRALVESITRDFGPRSIEDWKAESEGLHSDLVDDAPYKKISLFHIPVGGSAVSFFASEMPQDGVHRQNLCYARISFKAPKNWSNFSFPQIVKSPSGNDSIRFTHGRDLNVLDLVVDRSNGHLYIAAVDLPLMFFLEPVDYEALRFFVLKSLADYFSGKAEDVSTPAESQRVIGARLARQQARMRRTLDETMVESLVEPPAASPPVEPELLDEVCSEPVLGTEPLVVDSIPPTLPEQVLLDDLEPPRKRVSVSFRDVGGFTDPDRFMRALRRIFPDVEPRKEGSHFVFPMAQVSSTIQLGSGDRNVLVVSVHFSGELPRVYVCKVLRLLQMTPEEFSEFY